MCNIQVYTSSLLPSLTISLCNPDRITVQRFYFWVMSVSLLNQNIMYPHPKCELCTGAKFGRKQSHLSTRFSSFLLPVDNYFVSPQRLTFVVFYQKVDNFCYYKLFNYSD